MTATEAGTHPIEIFARFSLPFENNMEEPAFEHA